MERDYNKIGDEFASIGFFSEYLPPCFKFDEKILDICVSDKPDFVAPLSFTMSKFDSHNSRRKIFIPEIGSYLAVHKLMKDEDMYRELIEFTETEDYSFSPILEGSAVMQHERSYGKVTEENISNFIENIAKKIIKSSGAKKLLRLDISNFYSSFYTHMIPAIMLGTETAEKEHRKKLLNKTDVDPTFIKYSKLDKFIRNQNLQRTHGLLTGILSSKLIAEAILTRIDKELAEYDINFVRYVDDYEIFLYEDNVDFIISTFTSILEKYGFSLNSEKTEIVEFPFYILDNFEKQLNIDLKESIDYEDLIEIFNKFLLLEKNGAKGAVRFLLKKFAKYNLKVDDSQLYKSYLLTIIANDPRSLSKACSILINDKRKYSLSHDEKNNLLKVLQYHIKSGNDLEVVWIIYLLLELGESKSIEMVVDDIIHKNMDLALALLLRRNKLTKEQQKVVVEKATSWLLLYELFQQEYLDEQLFMKRLNITKNDSFYRQLKYKNIKFIV